MFQTSARIHDETLTPGGQQNKGWAKVMNRLHAFSAEEIARRQQQLSHQLRANGIAYSAANLNQVETRPWPLDLIPQVIEPADWQNLRDGLEQRGRLKKALLADLYGEQRVLLDGVLPASLVQAHAGYLRAARQLPGSNELPLYSVDVSRSPSGDWYVVDDRCQAPDGIGYTVENRLVLSHVLPGLFREARVQRVAGWFRGLQAYLSGVIDTDARCVMLAYGASHPHYFEYVYLAKYLGYTLVEISDLTVRNERVWLKTVDGLQRVDVILRFIADQHIDPLAVNNGNDIGIPGLLHAILAGTVHVINPLGTAVLDNPAFNAYLPALCRYYLDDDIRLLSAPTYWLGDRDQRAHVLEQFDDLLLRDVDTLGQLFDPRLMSAAERAAMLADIDLMPARYVAQERIDRSVAPSLSEANELPRQITLRTFLLDRGSYGGADSGVDRDPDRGRGYEVMSGGLCLLDRVTGGRRPAMAALEGSKDVWVLSSGPVRPDTLLPPTDDSLQYSMLEGELPSRVADNLFWFGRYAENAEHVIRVMQATCRELLSDDSPVDSDEVPAAQIALCKALTRSTGTLPGFLSRRASHRLQHPSRELQSLLLDADRVGSLAHSLEQVQRTANTVRDRLSPEILRVLNDLNDHQARTAPLRSRRFSTDPDALNATVEYLNTLLTSMAALTGLTSENLTRGDGWRFLMLGRRIERARLSSATIGTVLQHRKDDPRVLETLLRLFDSVITYRSRYRSQIDNRLVLHLLLLDETNPRSVAFQFMHIETLIRQLPGMRRAGNQDPLLRLATAGISRVRLASARNLLESGRGKRQSLKTFSIVLENIPAELGSALSATYFTHTESQRNLGTASVRSPEPPTVDHAMVELMELETGKDPV